MAENVQQSIEVPVPLELFGSLVTEMSPSDLPEGISPDNQDVVFLPGGVGSRPGLHAWLNGLTPGTSIMYQKTFVTPNGTNLNLILTSDGLFWVQNLTTGGNPQTLSAVAPGSYASSVSAFGKELITFHDGVNGTDIPRTYDGQFFDRATQGGPGAVCQVANLLLPSTPMASSGNTLQRMNNQVTCTTLNPHQLLVGYQAQISNVPDSNATTVNQTGTASTIVPINNWQHGGGGTIETINEPTTTSLGDLVFSGFGLSIPGTAIILGVSVSVGLITDTPTAGTLSQVSLWHSGAILGTAKPESTPFTTVNTPQSYGSSADIWGTSSGTLTPSIVNDTAFGFSVAVNQPDNIRLFITPQFQMTVFYTLSGPGTVGIVDSIVINNETNPGLALVTTSQPHGLAPQEFISLVGVEPGTVADITSAQWSAGLTTIQCATNHNLVPGAIVQIADVTTGPGQDTDFSFNGTFVVQTIPSPTEITYEQTPITATDPDVINATASTGNITISWPITDSPTPTYFQVQSAPTPTTFYIPISYGDGTWTSGTVGFIWEGIFYVTAVLSDTQFQYQQYGPNGATTAVGTVTPFGQAAPGLHNVVVIFQTREGLLTAPSPPLINFIANGGQYIQLSNVPIGPPNVIARIIAFTGANGGNYFYIPVPSQVNGIITSTSTVINDNTSTTITLDFSDNALFAALGIDIPGNNLFNLRTIGPCLGVMAYASRAAWFGWKNSITNLLNLGFEGGFLELTSPCGWTVVTPGATLDEEFTSFGMDWLITGDGTAGPTGQISQSAFEDAYSVAILQPSTAYTGNLRMSIVSSAGGISGIVVLDFFSPTSGSLGQATFNLNQTNTVGKFLQVNFTEETPAVIPSDTVLRLYGSNIPTGTSVAVDELEIYPTLNPTVPQFAFSYVNFPEALDAVTGILGATSDDTSIQTNFTYRDALLFLTQAKLHEINDNQGVEPYGWQVREVANNCGSCSTKGCSTGENFSVWVTSPTSRPPTGRGLYVYTGGSVYKLSQEIQPDFDNINPNAQQSLWTHVDSVTRRIYIGIPTGVNTTPNKIYVLDYREMDVAQDLASRGPIHISFSGKMVCSDLSRKWTRWNIPSNCGNNLNIPNLGSQFSVGLRLANSELPANSYYLDPLKLTDDDLGQINSYYTTYFFINHDAEQSMQVGLHRKLYKRYAASVTGVGNFNLIPLADTLTNPWPGPPKVGLKNLSRFDFGDGLNVSTERCAFKVFSSPLPGTTDNSFSLSKLIITLSQNPVSPIRFGAI